jgi:hypothetical protein
MPTVACMDLCQTNRSKLLRNKIYSYLWDFGRQGLLAIINFYRSIILTSKYKRLYHTVHCQYDNTYLISLLVTYNC